MSFSIAFLALCLLFLPAHPACLVALHIDPCRVIFCCYACRWVRDKELNGQQYMRLLPTGTFSFRCNVCVVFGFVLASVLLLSFHTSMRLPSHASVCWRFLDPCFVRFCRFTVLLYSRRVSCVPFSPLALPLSTFILVHIGNLFWSSFSRAVSSLQAHNLA